MRPAVSIWVLLFLQQTVDSVAIEKNEGALGSQCLCPDYFFSDVELFFFVFAAVRTYGTLRAASKHIWIER